MNEYIVTRSLLLEEIDFKKWENSKYEFERLGDYKREKYSGKERKQYGRNGRE